MRTPIGNGNAASTLDALRAELRRIVAGEEVLHLLDDLQIQHTEMEAQRRALGAIYRALAAAHERYMDLYDFAPIGLALLDRNGRICEINSTGASILGEQERSRLFGKVFVHSLSPGVGEAFSAYLDEAQKSGHEVRGEFTVGGAGGARELRVLMNAVAETQDCPGACRTAFMDVTEDNRMQGTLRLHDAILNHMAEGFVLMRMDTGEIVYANHKFEQIFGYDPGELVGQHLSVLCSLSGSECDATVGMIFNTLRVSGEWRGELPNRRKDGELLICEVSMACFAHHQLGNVWIGVYRDVTYKKQMESELHRRELFNRAVLDALSEEVCVLDRNGVIIAVNEAWRRFALARHATPLARDGVGMNYLAACERAEDGDARHAQAGLESVLSGKTRLFTMEYACPWQQDTRWFLLEATPLQTDGGGAVVTRIDITERVLAEQNVRRHQHELARATRVSILGEMATTLAHELNQPLAAIRLFSETALKQARETHGDPDLTYALEHITSQVRRARAIVGHLREFVRKGPTQRARIYVHHVIAKAVELLRPAATDKGVRLEIQLAAASPMVYADAIQLEQVLVNLVHNSIEAMTAAASRRRIVTISTELEGDQVTVTVRDTGPGVHPDVVRNLFEVFETTKSNGMGLGLAISRSIIESHGGRLWLEEAYSGGAAFHCTLPLAREEEENDGPTDRIPDR